MAAPSGTLWGKIVGSYGRIGIYRSVTTTNNKISGTIEIWFWSKYSVSDTNNTLYYNRESSPGSATTSKGSVSISTTHDSGTGWSTTNQKKIASYSYSDTRQVSDATRYVYAKLVNVDRVGGTMYGSITYTVPKLPTYTVTYNANGGNGAPSKQTKSYNIALTLSSTRPSRTGYTFSKWNTKSDGSGTSYNPGASFMTNANTTLYAIWTINAYSVTYNANGGDTNTVPLTQTKNYNTTFDLSSTKPRRTGYTFSKWNTKSDGTGTSYNSGASFKITSNATLYAIWTIDTYDITYNANGGSNAPSKQTKTYGKTLMLSSTKPTRADYNFLGWSTSSTATTHTYSAGANFTPNENTTLYAVWQLAYVKPKITEFGVARYSYNSETGSYTRSDTGTYAHVFFKWSTFRDVTNVKIEWSVGGVVKGTHTVTVSGKSGTVDEYIGGDISSESTYTVAITVTDSGGSSIISKYLPGAKYALDLLAGGNGVAFGKPAEKANIADFAFTIAPGGGFVYPVLTIGRDLNTVTTPNVYISENIKDAGYTNCPISSGTFTLEVLSAGGSGQVIQRLTWCHKLSGNTYERKYYSGSWGPWYGAWQTLDPSDEFSIYGEGTESDVAWNGIRYRKVGGIVEVRGVVTPKADIAYNTDFHLICTLPEGYRPDRPLYVICQGSGTCVWLLQVSHEGKVQFGRYRNGNAGAIATTGTWLPFQCTFTA